MALFNAIVVDPRKLAEYCLSESHHRGRNKARVFRSQLGLTAADAEALRNVLPHAVQNSTARAAVSYERPPRATLCAGLRDDHCGRRWYDPVDLDSTTWQAGAAFYHLLSAVNYLD